MKSHAKNHYILAHDLIFSSPVYSFSVVPLFVISSRSVFFILFYYIEFIYIFFNVDVHQRIEKWFPGAG